MVIVFKSSQTLNKDVNLDEDSNERRSDEQDNGKRIQLERSNYDVLNINGKIIENLKVFEKQVKSEKAP